MTDNSKRAPWRDGFWLSEKAPSFVNVVVGNSLEMKPVIALDYPDIQGGTASTIAYGDFGPAKREIAEATGVSNYNLAFSFGDKVMFHGVVNEEGTEMTTWGFSNSVEVMKLLSSEDVKRIKEDRDPLDEPSCPHIKPQPGKQGKIIWLSGPPGAGKSTTCQLMARKHDFVYYEADATMQFINPFVDLNVENPTVAAFAGKSLKGVSREDAEMILKAAKEMEKIWTSTDADGSVFDAACRPILKIMCREISKQKKRLGGSFAVAHAVVTRKSRDVCREALGDNVVFLVMNMTKKCQKERLKGRHGVGDSEDSDIGKEIQEGLERLYDSYEPAGEDEEGAYNVNITEDMSRDDVLKQVLDVIAKI